MSDQPHEEHGGEALAREIFLISMAGIAAWIAASFYFVIMAG
jgi:uncharacterized membrane protein